MQIRRGGRQKKVNAKSLNLFYNLFCMFTTIFRSPYSRAATFIDRLIMLFSAIPAKCGDKRGGGGSRQEAQVHGSAGSTKRMEV